MSDFETVVGLEVHVQLATDSKIFCSCSARLAAGKSVADLAPNSNTCPVCTGQPGALPVLNRKVVEYAVRAGLATSSTINRRNVFDRKNYFYPDMPKNYQTTQLAHPIAEHGHLDIETAAGPKRVSIVRIHIEEDAGKSTHHGGYSLVNLNRAGTPLVEIVSGPDLRSPEEAGAYLRALYAIVTYLGICDGNLQEGNFRCDANVSIRPKGATTLGTRTEIKNVNSFRFVEKAIEYEARRQAQVLQAGGRIVQETRLYDSDRNVTESMRSKEEAHDYRYFPDPDLIPVHVSEAWLAQIQAAMPELPEQRRARLTGSLGLSAYDAGVLTASKALVEFFESTIGLLGADGKAAAKNVANLLTGEAARLANEAGIEVSSSRLTHRHLADLALLLLRSEVSSTGAKAALQAAWKSGEPIAEIVERLGLRQVSDTSALEPLIEQILAENPAQAAELKAGKEKLMGFFVGQLMKRSQGKANPALLTELIRKKVNPS